MATKAVRPIIRIYAPLTIRSKEQRIVEAYCYVNPRVGDGYNLKRSSMEAATQDYLKWGAIREMHTNSAAGTCRRNDMPELGIFWDDVGAKIVGHISDDAAWKKVEDQTYKGFSVGVRPELVRGEDVESCKWIENSLVDRPADEDATITCYRAAVPGDECEVTELSADEPAPLPEINRAAADFNTQMAAQDYNEKRRGHIYRAMDILHRSVHSIASDPALKPVKREMMCRAAFGQAADHISPIVGASDTVPVPGGDPAEEGLRAALDTAIQRIKDMPDEEKPDAVQTAVTKALEEHGAAQAKQIAELTETVQNLSRSSGAMAQDLARVSKQPVRYHAVKFPEASQGEAQGLQRTFAGATEAGETPENAVTRLQSEIAEIVRSAKGERNEERQMELAAAISRKKMELSTAQAVAAML